MTGYGMDGVDSLPSRRLTRTIGLSFAPSIRAAASDKTVMPATSGGNTRIVIFHSRRFTRATLRLPLPSRISNRELDLLERELSPCKQKTATVPNRELSTVCNSTINTVRAELPAQESLSPLRERRSLPAISDTNPRPLRPFLTGSAPQTEFDVTPTKQKTEKILTGARTHISDFAIWRILR